MANLIRINDIEKVRSIAGSHVEKQQQEILDYIAQERSHLVYIDNDLVNPTNSVKQLGRTMSSTELENRLRTILPSSVTFIDNPYLQDKKAVVRILNRYDINFGTYETICPYERGIMPEHSVLQLNEVEVPDAQIIARKKMLDRKDLGKYEYVSGEGFRFNNPVTPGFVKTKQLGREIKRGWRTVLIKLIMAKIITVDEAERLFGQDATTSWAYHTGRKNSIDVPW